MAQRAHVGTVTRELVPYPFQARSHAPQLPEQLAGAERRRWPVAIVGGGVVGLASALALARHGVRCVVLEADDSVCVGSRAICISRRTLEILARLGALTPFLAKGLPWTGGRSFYRDAEVLRFSMPHDESQRLPPMINIQQYYIEQYLLDALESSPLVEVRWQSRACVLAHDADGACLEVATPLAAYRLHCDWVLGCDGARSALREAAALQLEGVSYEGRFVIVDIALRSARPTERLAWFDPPSNPGSTLLMHRQPDDVWRIDYQLRESEDPEDAVQPQRVIPRVASHLRMIGERDDWAPIWISLYKASALTLGSYRRGRILLAGDAAHLVPIFGVRGANSAFEDADNLSWKLALVLRGAAAETLLDSYSTERVQAARENLRQGMKSTEFMSPPSYGFELMRSAVLGLAAAHPFLRSLINPRQTESIAYEHSALNGPSVGSFAAGPTPGVVACDCPLTLCGPRALRPGHLSEWLESAFSVLCFTDAPAVPESFAALARELAALGVPCRALALTSERPPHPVADVAWDHTRRLFPLYGAAAGSVYLLRPDGYVSARWLRGAPAAVRQAIQRVLRGGIA